MNTQQRKYALERVDAIVKAKLSKIDEDNKRPVRNISDADRYNLVHSGAVKLRQDIDRIGFYDDVRNAFDFSTFECGGGADPAVVDPLKAAVKVEAGRIRDQIMLGDAEEALALLTAFAS